MIKTHLSPQLITTPQQLAEVRQALLSQPVVAVDTESNSLFAYRERVCLIQFSIPGHDYLVDPLAIDDISGLGDVFADPEIEKIFHAAEYDLLVLKRDFDFSFTNLFDTMVAARILGRRRVGLGSLLEDEFDVKVEKKYQRSDWGRRPLPPEMRNYAALDTYFLIQLRNLLYQELIDANRWALAKEDFFRLAQVNGTPPEPHGADVWRVNGVHDLTPHQVTILRYLAEYREERAKQLDRPLFKVIGDKTLAAIAEAQPETLEELSEIDGMTKGQLHRHGKALLKAVQQGQKDNPTYRPHSKRLDDDILDTLDSLRNWRKVRARKLGVESDVVLPRDVMEQIAHKQPEDWNTLSEVLAEVPWRRDKFGQDIYRIVAKSHNGSKSHG